MVDLIGSISFDVYFLVRYDIVQKWREPYTFSELKYQRTSFTISKSLYHLDKEAIYCDTIHKDENLYKIESKVFTDKLISVAKQFLRRYSSLKKIYREIVLPILLKDPNEHHYSCSDALYDRLTVCRIVAPELYPLLKEILYDEFKERYYIEAGHRSLNPGPDQADKVLSALECVDFKAMMNKKGWTTDDVIPLDQFI